LLKKRTPAAEKSPKMHPYLLKQLNSPAFGGLKQQLFPGVRSDAFFNGDFSNAGNHSLPNKGLV
jgi:hypothetical protein